MDITLSDMTVLVDGEQVCRKDTFCEVRRGSGRAGGVRNPKPMPTEGCAGKLQSWLLQCEVPLVVAPPPGSAPQRQKTGARGDERRCSCENRDSQGITTRTHARGMGCGQQGP